jgi:signal-transduction protein with cAMP-binding, CBS, and nucleotidyltransferase domain
VSDAVFVPVREVMTASPAAVDGLATVAEALAVMRERKISSLVVDRRDEQDEYGLVLIGDIAREVIAQGRSLERVSVYEIMTKPALGIEAGMNIRYAVRLLTRLCVSHCLVLERRELAGIVTLRDMTVRHFEAFRSSQA